MIFARGAFPFDVLYRSFFKAPLVNGGPILTSKASGKLKSHVAVSDI